MPDWEVYVWTGQEIKKKGFPNTVFIAHGVCQRCKMFFLEAKELRYWASWEKEGMLHALFFYLIRSTNYEREWSGYSKYGT